MEDIIIDKITALRTQEFGSRVLLEEDEMHWLFSEAIETFKSQPMLIQIDGRVNFLGNIHGDIYTLLRIFEYGGDPSDTQYGFLGNYINNGNHSIEVLCLGLAYKIKYPETFIMLRGNHDSLTMSRIYGGYDEFKTHYGFALKKLFKNLTDGLNWIPLAAIVNEKIFGVHGGICPEVNDISEINHISRPDYIADGSVSVDLLWTDPSYDVTELGYAGGRDVTYIFGVVTVDKFLKKFDFDLIVRSHQLVWDGYEYFANKKLITLYSTPKFGGEYENIAGMMTVESDCSYKFRSILFIVNNKSKNSVNKTM